MSGFAEGWLALREPADGRARCEALVAELGIAAARDEPLAVIDLGAGTGANLRYLAPRIGGPQRWRLVDDDGDLLGRARAHTRAWAGAEAIEAIPEDEQPRPRAGDTGSPFTLRGAGFECVVTAARLDLAGGADELSLPPGALVTASALLDLVSAEWLRSLARRCARAGAAVLFALTYDGRIELRPADDGDDRVRALVNLHQRRDKGFGPALGPAAASAAADAFEAVGYRVRSAAADWRLGPADAALQRELLDGWLAAACEAAPGEVRRLRSWHGRRREHVDAARSEIVVGHADMAGRPAQSTRLNESAEASSTDAGALRRSQSKSTSPPMRKIRCAGRRHSPR